jgi:hypothetical protein
MEMIVKALRDSNVKVAVCSYRHTLRILDIIEKNTKEGHHFDLTTLIQIQEHSGTTTLLVLHHIIS